MRCPSKVIEHTQTHKSFDYYLEALVTPVERNFKTVSVMYRFLIVLLCDHRVIEHSQNYQIIRMVSCTWVVPGIRHSKRLDTICISSYIVQMAFRKTRGAG